jgi:hypothetical protein
MHRVTVVAVALLVLAGLPAPAETPDPAQLVGATLAEAYAALGAPSEVFVHRGTVAAEDDVVFFYPACCYLFWHGNRAWQVSFDRRYAGEVLGFRLGMDRAAAEEVAPGRLRESDGSLWLSTDSGRFPLRVRLVLADGRVDAIYVFRSDW